MTRRLSSPSGIIGDPATAVKWEKQKLEARKTSPVEISLLASRFQLLDVLVDGQSSIVEVIVASSFSEVP